MKFEVLNTGNISNPIVAEVFNHYPKQILPKLLQLRQLVIKAASEIEGDNLLEETLKWGEPSYLVKNGSTVRMAWKKATPEQYALYFHCQTKLVDTFKQLYSDKLKFEGNRAIVFHSKDEIPIDAVKHCIFLSFTYHSRKHLPMLGV